MYNLFNELTENMMHEIVDEEINICIAPHEDSSYSPKRSCLIQTKPALIREYTGFQLKQQYEVSEKSFIRIFSSKKHQRRYFQFPIPKNGDSVHIPCMHRERQLVQATTDQIQIHLA